MSSSTPIPPGDLSSRTRPAEPTRDGPTAPRTPAVPPGRRRTRCCEVPVRLIDPDPEPLRIGDDATISGLARSLQEHGQLQPVVLRPSTTPGRYLLVCGRRRWLAARRIGLETLTALVLDAPPDAFDPPRLRLIQLAENLSREGLSAVDQAVAFEEVMQGRGWDGRKLAEAIGIGPGAVARALNLLSLPAEVLDDIATGRIPPPRSGPVRPAPAATAAAPPTATTNGGAHTRRAAAVVETASRRTPIAAGVASAASIPPARPSASRKAGTTRIFSTPYGRVTLELNGAGSAIEMAGAMAHVARAICISQAVQAGIDARRDEPN